MGTPEFLAFAQTFNVTAHSLAKHNFDLSDLMESLGFGNLEGAVNDRDEEVLPILIPKLRAKIAREYKLYFQIRDSPSLSRSPSTSVGPKARRTRSQTPVIINNFPEGRLGVPVNHSSNMYVL